MTTPLTFGDCHTHLDQYDAAELPGLVERAAEVGVTSVILAGTTLESTRACIGLAGQFDAFSAGVGIHPCQAYERVDDAMYDELERLAQSPKVVCISEVGLDYLPESPDHAVQDQVFRQHIRLAKSLDLPIIFHSREAHSAVFQVLREESAGDVGGAMHYFQADEATAREAIDCGFYISLARPLTRLPEVQEAAAPSLWKTSCWKPTPFLNPSRSIATTGPSRGTWPRWRSAWRRSRACQWKRWRR